MPALVSPGALTEQRARCDRRHWRAHFRSTGTEARASNKITTSLFEAKVETCLCFLRRTEWLVRARLRKFHVATEIFGAPSTADVAPEAQEIEGGTSPTCWWCTRNCVQVILLDTRAVLW